MITVLAGNDLGVKQEVLELLSTGAKVVDVTGELDFETVLDLILTDEPIVFNGFPVSDKYKRALERIMLSKEACMAVFIDRNEGGPWLTMALKSSLPTMKIYSDDPRTAEWICLGLSLMRSKKNLGDGIGAFVTGNILVVGDTPGKLKRHVDLPFATDVGSGAWLNQQMDRWHCNERNFYWINATRADGTETDSSFVSQLKPTKVLALGNNAEKWCKKHNITCQKIPHPSYWKRFKSKEEYLFFRYC